MLESLASVQIETGSLAKSFSFLTDLNASLILARSDSVPACMHPCIFSPQITRS